MCYIYNGQVTGVDKNEVYHMKRDFINCLNNPNMFKPSLYLELEEFDYDGMTVLWTYVPPTSSLCYCNKRVYDRNDDSEVVARAYKTVLQEFPRVFKQIEFAIYRPASGSRNYDVFSKTLG